MTDHSTPQADADAADPTRQKLESLFKMLRSSDGPTPGDSNSVSQRFRLLRRHASGGLGDIWIAQDEELNREVALKEIQPQFAGHEQSWSRFLREATITDVAACDAQGATYNRPPDRSTWAGLRPTGPAKDRERR